MDRVIPRSNQKDGRMLIKAKLDRIKEAAGWAPPANLDQGSIKYLFHLGIKADTCSISAGVSRCFYFQP